MRSSLMLILAVGLIAAACGDDAVDTTSSNSQPTETTATTTTSSAGDTTVTSNGGTTDTSNGGTTDTSNGGTTVPHCDLPVGSSTIPPYPACVVNAGAENVNVRCGPGTTSDTVGSLAPDATGVQITGLVAPAANSGIDWFEIEFGSDTAWVSSTYLTPDPCTGGATYNCPNCADALDVYAGPGDTYNFLGTLPPNSPVNTTGFESDGFVQVALTANTMGWVGQGFVRTTSGTCSPCQWPLTWTIHPSSSLGPLHSGVHVEDLEWFTGYEWNSSGSTPCLLLTTPAAGSGVELYSYSGQWVDEIHVTDTFALGENGQVAGTDAQTGDPISLLGGNPVSSSGTYIIRQLPTGNIAVHLNCRVKPDGRCFPFPEPTIKEFIVWTVPFPPACP